MKAGRWDAPLTLQDLAEAICTILGYSNDKNIYCKEYYFDWQANSRYKI